MSIFRKYAKAVLAFAFGLSPAAVVGILALFRVHLDESTVVAFLTAGSPLLATLGVAVGPANAPSEPAINEPNNDELETPVDIVNSWF